MPPLYHRVLPVERGFLAVSPALILFSTTVLKSCVDFPLGILLTWKVGDNCKQSSDLPLSLTWMGTTCIILVLPVWRDLGNCGDFFHIFN